MESFKEFLNRINRFEKLDFLLNNEYFTPDPSIYSKVNTNNEFSRFYGDTTVFDLEHDTKKRISKIIDVLYSKSIECFCEKRVTDTLHMTLHDLSNSTSKSKIKKEVKANFIKLKEVIKETPIPDQKIKMKTNFITDFGHVNLVLALCPVNEEEYKKLMNIRSTIDRIKKLDYEYTPHVTLAYFNSKGFGADSVKKLVKVVRNINKEESFDVILDTKQLIYQTFSDMNNYTNILYLTSKQYNLSEKQ